MLGSILVDIFKSAINGMIERGVAIIKENIEYKAFLSDVESWCDNFIKRNESTVVATSAFFHYLKYYKLIENIINFIQSPISRVEGDFLSACNDNACDCLKKEKDLTPDDIRSVKEFIEGVFEKTRAFYEDKLSIDDTLMHYQLVQANAKLDDIRAGIRIINTQNENTCPVVFKKTYSMPNNTILRKIALYKDIQDHYFISLHSENMLDVCLREKHVIVLGEAGCGKSVAIGQLASLVAGTEYYPLRFDLSDYTDETIEKIINDDYYGLDYSKLFLIFDAYDEIEEKNRNLFARKINRFVALYPNTIIVVSSRNNFYRFANDDGTGGLLDGFKEYGVAPITNSDIIHYMEKNGVDSHNFFDEIQRNDLYYLFRNPFYLCELIKIYKRNSSLPPKADLMEEIIRNRFNMDCEKYATTVAMFDDELELFSCLEKLAFAIQCMKTTKISNLDYQRLFESKTRELIKYSGIFTKDANGKWSFEHNNFREYLAAKYINRFDMSEIRSIMFSPENKLIDSWLNVFSFLVLIRDENDLLSFLVDNDPEKIVRFERERVDEDSRAQIVINILDSFAEKNIWITHGINSSDVIARFGQSAKLCEYLLKHIEESRHFREQYNALSVLSEITELYGMHEQTRKVLFNCLLSESVRYHEKYNALDALVSLELQTQEITNYIVENFSHEMDAHYRLGVLKYLHNSDLFERYIDFFVEEYKICERFFDESTSIRCEILEVFGEVNGSEALCKVIPALAIHRHSYSTDEEKYSIVISNAIHSYKCGNKKIFDAIFDILIDCELHNNRFFKNCIVFLEETKTKVDAFIRLVDLDIREHSYKNIYAIKEMGDDECYMSLLAKYRENPHKYQKIIQSLLIYFDEDSTEYKNYIQALEENGTVVPKRKPHFNYPKAMQLGRQYYFDCLFDKEKYCSLVEKFVVSCGNPHIAFSELCDIDYHPVNYDDTENNTEEYALLQLYYRFSDYTRDHGGVLDTICGISDWDRYIISESYRLLQMEGDYTISEEQKGFFESFCRSLVDNIDFQKEISEDDDHSISCTQNVWIFIFFSEYFDIYYDKSVYLKMLSVPYCFFKSRDNKRYDDFSLYLTSKLSIDEMKIQIKDNLLAETLCSDSIDMHIRFCKDHNLDFAIEAAEKVCLDKSSKSWRKQKCIEYIEQLRSCDYIYEKFLEIEDSELIESIINVTMKYKDDRLRIRLEILNRESANACVYLKPMILLNSQYALHRYYELAKSAMKASLSGDSVLDPIIESISYVNDIEVLNELGNLRILLFTPGFQDKTEFGLSNSLYKAYQSLATIDYATVREHLENALKIKEISEPEISFCNTLIMDIEYTKNRNNDIAWSISEIKDFIKAREELLC